MVNPSKLIKKNEDNISHKEELREGCEVFEAVKAIGKMIMLYYSAIKD